MAEKKLQISQEDSVKVSTGPAQSEKGRTKVSLQKKCFARLKYIQPDLSHR